MSRIVIVLEDDPNVRTALVILMEDWGWQAVAAATASEALGQLGSVGEVGAIVTDYNLGEGINGVDEVKAMANSGVQAPVLVLSGSMRGKAQEAALAAGHQYLAKPVRPPELQAWLDRIS
jgi:CheY-like chemotaxis protein